MRNATSCLPARCHTETVSGRFPASACLSFTGLRTRTSHHKNISVACASFHIRQNTERSRQNTDVVGRRGFAPAPHLHTSPKQELRDLNWDIHNATRTLTRCPCSGTTWQSTNYAALAHVPHLSKGPKIMFGSQCVLHRHSLLVHFQNSPQNTIGLELGHKILWLSM